MHTRLGTGAGILLLLSPLSAYPQRTPEPSLRTSAIAFLAALAPEQKQKAQFPFNSDERLNWHFIPKARNGLPLKAMSEAQRDAAKTLLKAGLSAKGLKKVAEIQKLETVLFEMENKNPTRDTDLYYVTIFGEPSDKGAWGWRYEGHHLSLNWTSLNGKIIASSPQFFGTNPGEVRQGPLKGLRVLAAEEDLARALLNVLTPEQRTEAIIGTTAPNDIITGAERKVAILEDKGIAYKALTPAQQGMLLAVIQEHATAQTAQTARKRLDAIRKAGLDTIKFAWMGSAEKGQGHYYRVQGKTFLIEYDNTQNNANHVHTAWRDFKGDFGADLLEMHYRASAH